MRNLLLQGPRCSIRSRKLYSDAVPDYLKMTLLNLPAAVLVRARPPPPRMLFVTVACPMTSYAAKSLYPPHDLPWLGVYAGYLSICGEGSHVWHCHASMSALPRWREDMGLY